MIVSIGAFFLFAITIVSMGQITQALSTDPLAYQDLLPPSFWFGLILSITSPLCLILSGDCRGRVSLQVVSFSLPILYLIVVPCLLYETPVFTDVYGIIQSAQTVSVSGHSDLAGGLEYTQAFPGMLFWIVEVSNVEGMSILMIAKYYPIWSFFLLSLLIFAISRVFFKEYAFVAPVVHLAFVIAPLYNMVPQNLSLILFVTATLAVFKLMKSSHNRASYSVVLMLIATSVAITHPGTSVMLVLLLGSIVLFLAFTPLLETARESVPRTSTLSLFAFSLVVFLAWLSHIAYSHFQLFVDVVGSIMTNISGGFFFLETGGYNFNAKPPIPMILDVIVFETFVFFVILSLAVLLLVLEKRVCGFLALFTVSAMIAPLLQWLTTGAYLGRNLIFLNVLGSFFIALMISIRHQKSERWMLRLTGQCFTTVVLSATTVFLIVNPITAHYIDPHEHVTGSIVASSEFYYEFFHLNITGYNGTWAEFRLSYFFWDNLTAHSNFTKEVGARIVFSNIAYNFYEIKQSSGTIYSQAILLNIDKSECIYANPSTRIFVRR